MSARHTHNEPTRLLRRWLAVGVLTFALATTTSAWPAGAPPSGDPGGRVMRQLVPAASALPGYGTSRLAWVTARGLSKLGVKAAFVIKFEPFQTSCDGVARTRGWSQVVLQAGFPWPGTPTSLFAFVDRRLRALGWHRIPIAPDHQSSGGEAMWWLHLGKGRKATAQLTRVAPSYRWEFVATAPPSGKAASGC